MILSASETFEHKCKTIYGYFTGSFLFSRFCAAAKPIIYFNSEIHRKIINPNKIKANITIVASMCSFINMKKFLS